ncbi:MAG: hypothetical protein HPZ91_15375 [Lentisphaeria bacterium]|nr:hypothetical protein [Lentisphaeria bacterium]
MMQQNRTEDKAAKAADGAGASPVWFQGRSALATGGKVVRGAKQLHSKNEIFAVERTRSAALEAHKDRACAKRRHPGRVRK